MKKLLIVLLLLTSCVSEPVPGEYKKPFIIVWKKFEAYEYVDSIGMTHSFLDSIGRYNIGDTIK